MLVLGIDDFPPAEIKKAVAGTGGATKEQVQYMLMRLLRLKSVPHPSDAADGVAAALAYAMSVGVTRLQSVAEPGRDRAAERARREAAIAQAAARLATRRVGGGGEP